MFITEEQSLKYKRSKLIKPCFYKKYSYMFMSVHIEMHIYTHKHRARLLLQIISFTPIEYKRYKAPYQPVLVCTGNKCLQTLCASAGIARKSEIVGNQSQGDLFQQQAGPELSSALHQLKECAFLLSELTLCYRQNEPAEIKDYSCDLFLCSRAECTVKFHHCTWLAFWKVKKPGAYIN